MMLAAIFAISATLNICDRCGHVFLAHTQPLDRPAIVEATRTAYHRRCVNLTDSDRRAFVRIVRKESSFDPNMENPTSTSSTLNGFLDSTWQSTGIDKTDCIVCQLEAMSIYIENRYGSPSRALRFHDKNGWY